MRWLVRIVGASVLAGAVVACAAIGGLGSYTSGDCKEDCDASVGRSDAGRISLNDATADGGVAAADGAGDDSADGGGGEDGGEAGTGAGCGSGLIECEAGCVDPSLPATCGACSNACEGDASMCADLDGSFGCTSTCPPQFPTPCSGSCVDTTSSADNCMTCGNTCTTAVANAKGACVNSACTFACDSNYTPCSGACIDFTNDSSNCGGCGAAFACGAGQTCVESSCQSETADAGPDTGSTSGVDAGHDSGSGGTSDAGIACPAGGCPSSTATGFSCPTLGHCNGTTSECSTSGGCFCSNDSQCATKCVKVTGENDVACASNCTGAGGRDGYNCELATPGIPVPSGTSTYACPTNAGYHSSQLSCDLTDTNCYCTADSQCPSGKCIANAATHAACTSCSGSGTPDYRGCQAPTAPSSGTCYTVCGTGTCTAFAFGTCVCNNDSQCESGKCASSCGANCTGSGTAQANGCVAPPSSVACASTGGGTACVTTLTPAPVLNTAKTACLCVADSNCPSGKCVNASSRCTGTCTGTGTPDAEGCEVASSVANSWSCAEGNCNNVSSPSGTCTSAGVPCWCTSDAQCPSGAQCSSWAGCAAGACTGSGTGNPFNCVP